MRPDSPISTVAFLTPAVLLAVVVACAFSGQAALASISMEDMTAMPCCSLQRGPDIYAAIAQTAIPDTARALLTIAVATAAFIFGVGAVGLQQKDTIMRIFSHRMLSRSKGGGFLRAMRRGIVHPQLYEPVVVLI